MKRSKYSAEQTTNAIRQAESGTPVGEVNRAIWVDQLFHPGMPVRSAWEIMAKRLQRIPTVNAPHGIVSQARPLSASWKRRSARLRGYGAWQ